MANSIARDSTRPASAVSRALYLLLFPYIFLSQDPIDKQDASEYRRSNSICTRLDAPGLWCLLRIVFFFSLIIFQSFRVRIPIVTQDATEYRRRSLIIRGPTLLDSVAFAGGPQLPFGFLGFSTAFPSCLNNY